MRTPRRAANFLSALLLVLTSGYVVLQFVTPITRHAGINDHPEALFEEMLSGKAHKPFVTRALLPWTVKAIRLLTPRTIRTTTATFAGENRHASWLFERMHWSTSSAFEYLLTVLLFWLCFLLFARFTASLTIVTCSLSNTIGCRTGLACLSLIGLPPLFRFTSFIYDPPQLFLFAAAGYFIASRRHLAFLLSFAAASANKETAILLIPLWLLGGNTDEIPAAPKYGFLLLLLSLYLSIRGYLLFMFQGSPGDIVRLHLFDHNVQWLVKGYSISDLLSALVLTTGLFYKWNHKSKLLRVGLPSILLPLLVAGFFFGYFDEWRDYLEAYPICFSLIVDSAFRLTRQSNGGCGT